MTCDEPVLTLTIGQALDEACARIPDHVMMIIPHHDQSYTISELRDMVGNSVLIWPTDHAIRLSGIMRKYQE